MYADSARYYDAIYGFKDYAAEVERITALAGPRTSLLDVACGTGKHLSLLAKQFDAEGLELSTAMAEIARAKGLRVTEGDMRDFELARTFDVVTCLFSSIGYMADVAELERAVASMARHLNPGGVLMVEPWLREEQYTVGHLSLQTVDEPDLKIARTCVSERDGRHSVMDMHHLVTTSEGVRYFVENHRLTMFTDQEYLAAFTKAGLRPELVDGLTGRGLVVGWS